MAPLILLSAPCFAPLNIGVYHRCSMHHNTHQQQLIVYVLKEGLKVEARQLATGTLFYLASIKEYRILIRENPQAIPALIELIKNENYRCKKNAMVAIFGLLVLPENHWRVLTAGGVPLLVNVLKSCDVEDLVIDSLAILATLAEKSKGAVLILDCGALDPIMKLLSSSTSSSGKEYCVSLLLALCINGGTDVVSRLVKSPSLMQSLYSQLTEGTSRASKKASALIKILHEFNERRSSSGSRASVLPQDRSVHV